MIILYVHIVHKSGEFLKQHGSMYIRKVVNQKLTSKTKLMILCEIT